MPWQICTADVCCSGRAREKNHRLPRAQQADRPRRVDGAPGAAKSFAAMQRYACSVALTNV
jgi:hypothetical protein